MVYPEELGKMMFIDIKNVRPQKRLIIAERIRFLALKGQGNENIVSYAQRLREASRFCNFEKLGKDGQSAQDDLIQMRLIDGLQYSDQRIKALEMLQNDKSPKLGLCVDFIRKLEQISSFSLVQNNIDKEKPNKWFFIFINIVDSSTFATKMPSISEKRSKMWEIKPL